ncbi:MAG: FKBP-type peptidyl-prolyl cis-trans isomerase [Candidatus Acidiferrum sp.]
MCQTIYRALIVSAAGLLLCGIGFAQQSPAPSSNPPAGSTTAPATPKTTTPKSGTTAAKKAAAPLALNTQKEKASYAIGMNIGKNLKESMKKQDVEVNPDILLRGLKDAFTGNKLLLTDDQAQAVLTAFQEDLRNHQKEVHDAEAAKNSTAGQAFLAANKAKPGIVMLPSGLQYKVITEGNGPKPTMNDVVVCNYKGTLIDGTEFDSSTKRGKPATIPVGKVIRGWTEALQLMPVGSTWQLFIPPSLGYGEAGTNGGPIGPDETLIFEVQLISIEPKPEGRPAPPGMATPGGTAPQPNGRSATPPPSSSQPAPSSPAPSTEPTPAPAPKP